VIIYYDCMISKRYKYSLSQKVSAMNRSFGKFLFLCSFTISLPIPLHAFDTVHFFRPAFLFPEPRFEKPGLSSLFLYGANGHSCVSKNGCGTTVPLLDLYGPHTVQFSGIDISAPVNPFLQAIAALPAGHNLSLGSEIHVFEALLDWYQNITHGFFIEAQIPFRRLRFSPVQLHDITSLPLRDDAAWQDFLKNFDTVIRSYGLTRAAHTEQGLGDAGLALGWTKNYEGTEYLDFIDGTLKLGVTLPMSKQRTLKHILDIPLGYNGHTGLFIEGEASIGLYDWITVGAYGKGLFFNKIKSMERIKTDKRQQGLLLFQQDIVHESLGNIAAAGVLAKADHIIFGLSLTLGYQYNRQGKSAWFNCQTKKRYPFCDQRLAGFNMHIFHLALEYDFATDDNPCAPVIGFIYNKPVGGTHCMLPVMTGGYLGFNIAWCS
jgi:hypothetical protein